jgi:hypothetical protein
VDYCTERRVIVHAKFSRVIARHIQEQVKSYLASLHKISEIESELNSLLRRFWYRRITTGYCNEITSLSA